MGKKTILNRVYYILTKKYDKLFGITFDEISVEFAGDHNVYTINKNDIREYNMKKTPAHRMIHQNGVMEYLISEYLNEYFDMFSNVPGCFFIQAHLLISIILIFQRNDHQSILSVFQLPQ